VKRILIVDDDPDILCSLEAFLIGRYDVAIAQDGREALELVRKGRFDAIVLDLMMPIMDGKSFLAALDRLGGRTPVIIASAWSDMGGPPGSASVVGYLRKPYDPEELEEQIDRATRGAAGIGA
jgi:CheY-like chemotaxis protein